MVASFAAGLAISSLVFYLFPSLYLGRGVFAISLALSLAGCLLVRLAISRWKAFGFLRPRVLVLGTGPWAKQVQDVLDNTSIGEHVNVLGFVRVNGGPDLVRTALIIEAPPGRTLAQLAREQRVDEIVIAVRDRRGGLLPVEDLLQCRLDGTRVVELATFYEREHGQVRLESLTASWMILNDGFRQSLWREGVKRVFDVVCSLALLIVTSPIMLLTAIAIVLESGLPIFYRQERVGQGNRSFNIVKFRSMHTDAEKDGKPRWAQQGDARVTAVGRVIRKLRIDELPQIINVLQGDMSFVGPRPERPFFVQKLAPTIPYYAARHTVKPGITGWAQVRYAYGATVDDAIEKHLYDLYYVKNHSLFLDMMILLDTVQVVLWGKGAR